MAINVGDIRRISIIFYDEDGVEADPTAVTVQYREPGIGVTELEYGVDLEVKKEAVGKYYLDISLKYSGIYKYSWCGTGAIEVAEDGSFTVERLEPPSP